MRPGPWVHGVLLAGALGVGWMTWTRDRTVLPTAATISVWSDAGPVTGLVARSKLRDVTVEKREEGYLWAKVDKRSPAPPRPAVPDGGVAETSPTPDTVQSSITEFPVSEDGEKALAKLAPLKALRDLGTQAARDEYGLGDESEKVVVRTGDKSHEVTLGSKVFGGDDRYVLDGASGHVFVVPGEAIRLFDVPEFSMRERKTHGFALTDVETVTLKTAAKERAIVRRAKASPLPHDATHAARPAGATYSDAASADKPDDALTAFMERVELLTPTDFGKAPEKPTPVLSVEYRSKDGKVLGTMEVVKAGEKDYYVKSERTRGYAKTNAAIAGKVEGDLSTIVP